MNKYDAVPDVLKDLPNWVVWKYESRDSAETKVPYDAKPNGNHIHAKSNDSSTWARFDRAAEVADIFSGNDYDGIGFMLQGTRLVGFDFDGVVSDGKAEPYVLNILEKLGNPYCEITPSGNGLRAFVEYPIPLPHGGRKFSRNTIGKFGAEIYSGAEGGRYLTVTGKHFSGHGISKILDMSIPYFMVSQICNEKLKSLWMGDLSAYDGDESRADLALLGILARLFDNNSQKIESVFSASKLGQRDKWTQRQDYRDRSIAKAIRGNETKSEPAAAPQSVEVGKSEPEPQLIEEPLPDFPEFKGSIVDLSEALAPDLPYCLKFMAAVTIIGGLLSGKVYMRGSTHIDPRFYTVMIDTKGAGKGGSYNVVREALSPLVLGELNIVPSIDSGPALVLELAQYPKTMLYADELDKVFETAKPTGSSRNSLFAELLTLYDGHETGNSAKANFVLPKEFRNGVCKNGANIKVNNARFSLLGCVQPDVFATMWRGVKGGANGLQSRFVLVSSGNNSVPEPQRPDSPAVRKIIERITDQILLHVNADAPRFIEMSSELNERLHAWWRDYSKDHPKASTRTPAMLIRMLLVLAVTNDMREIPADLVEQVIKFGEYQIALAERFMPSDAMTWTAAFEDLILRALRKHGGMGLTFNQIRRYVNPEKHQLLGGFGPFLQAWNNLKSTKMVNRLRTNVRGFDVFAVDE